MKILINENNIKKISTAINDIQKNAKVRKLVSKDIYNTVEKLVKKLDIPKKYLNDITIWCDIHAQDFPRAYFKKSYIKPESTQFEITFLKGKPYLTDISRTNVKKVRYSFLLNEIVNAKIVENFITSIQW